MISIFNMIDNKKMPIVKNANRFYFLDEQGKHLFYKQVCIDSCGRVKYRFDEVTKEVNGDYAPRYLRIIEKLRMIK